jgi:hypothetical protein
VAGALATALGLSLGIPEVSGYQLIRGRDFVWAPALRPVSYWVADMPDNWMTVDEVVAETRAAFDAWTAPAEVGLAFSYRGKTNQRPFEFFDRTNTVGFSSREHLAELGLSEATLAVTSWLTVIETGVIAEADVLVNPAYNWTDTPERGGWDYRSTMIHEAGHFLGLGHSGVGRQSEGSVLAGSSVMWPFGFGSGTALGRELTADDITGAALLYPGAAIRSGSIRGVVRRASGEAVRHAHVVAYEPLLDHTVGGWGDGEGNYEIAGLPDGSYVLRVNPIPETHGARAYFFPFGSADTDFAVSVHPRLVLVAEGQATEVNLEVGP